MDDTIAKALLTALQGVFRKHASAGWFGTDETFNPFNFPPEWEAARIAIYNVVAVDPAVDIPVDRVE